ncbi:primosomal replication protein PriC [Flocculibacter collagenilyticus]|uniref:primosomal replication protein PriC n=1 Tax=Flocculibacter collagenilyticus TaxID=2744479 RepID=UPI0018F50A65|nr:primosomal replication protein PriC [Flocculibacter collagenilyticus]
MQKIIEQLNENLKQLYRQAVDADNFIESMQQQGKGKFSAVFKQSNLFEGSSKYFKPYVAEVAADVSALEPANELDKLDQEKLAVIVKKLELLHSTLAQFKTVIKAANS